MHKKLVVATIGGALLFGSSLTAGVASADTPGARACSPWNAHRSEGGGSGQMCNGNHATGTIYDAKADGRCPFIKFYYIGGGSKQSPQVGPAGTSKSISVWAASGKQFSGKASAEWRSC